MKAGARGRLALWQRPPKGRRRAGCWPRPRCDEARGKAKEASQPCFHDFAAISVGGPADSKTQALESGAHRLFVRPSVLLARDRRGSGNLICRLSADRAVFFAHEPANAFVFDRPTNEPFPSGGELRAHRKRAMLRRGGHAHEHCAQPEGRAFQPHSQIPTCSNVASTLLFRRPADKAGPGLEPRSLGARAAP